MNEDEKNSRSDDMAFVILALAYSAPAFLIFAYFGDLGRARAAGISVFIIMLAARARWGLKNKVWFWIVISIIALFHILLVLLVSWGDKSYPGYTLLPVGVLDYAVVYGAIRLGEKLSTITSP